MELILEPTLFFQYGKGLITGGFFGWFIASLLYYRHFFPREEEEV
jgi:hypothetical protein